MKPVGRILPRSSIGGADARAAGLV